MQQKMIRNFAIIAHIDHGKSTLADRIIENTKTLEKREMSDQILDSMELEQERGITIKLNAIQLKYHAKDNKDYIFHLIDTPGHVDFTYEVSRSLAASDGAILLIDAAQGVEAQTIANAFLAIDAGLEILPVINKIDLPSARVDEVKNEIKKLLGLDVNNIPLISSKNNLNIEDVLEAIVKKLPPPSGNPEGRLKALIFDSYFDTYKGAIAYIRIVDGRIKIGDKIKFYSNDKDYVVTELGISTPHQINKDELTCGEVGWVSAAIKTVSDINVGDTITHIDKPTNDPFPGYKKLNPMVFTGFYPIDSNKYNAMRTALNKLTLSDSSLTFEPESSKALGFGFRCGFLGLLHMEIIKERIEREFNIDLIATAPSVIYHIHKTNGEVINLESPEKMPETKYISKIKEPIVRANIILPSDYIGVIMELCQSRRGIYIRMDYIDDKRSSLIYDIPLGEIVFDFFDKLKSYSKGYASFDYELNGYKESKLVKLDILVNKEIIDALSIIVHKDFAFNRGNIITKKLKEIIPKKQFEIPIQAVVGNKVIARETIKALRKNVLSKCYGGDITRKRKLLEKQKEGKKKMKTLGSIDVPQEAFMSVLSIDDD